ncbi:MAG: hypothetical protein K8R35_00380 [Bacteroidales bacterium]|nr:hypothetical protein [Bacteroidales bacterium]
MTAYSDFIRKIVGVEEQLDLYHYKVKNYSIWRLLRSSVIDHLLESTYQLEQRDSVVKKVNTFKIGLNYFQSLLGYTKLFLRRTKSIDNLIFAFPRLQKYDDKYLDRFTDPVLKQSTILNDRIIFQRPLAGSHKKPRHNLNDILKTDFVEFTSKAMGVILLPMFILFNFKPVYYLYKKAKDYFNLGFSDLLLFYIKIGAFSSSYRLHYLLFKKLKPKRLFLVNREVNYGVIHACKNLDITSYEMQHGVNFSQNILYSGKFDDSLDPDYLLTFGEFWRTKQFGIPPEKVINIGWAYSNFVNYTNTEKFSNQTVLVVSEPTISSKIIFATSKIAQSFPDHTFHIRLHPQERLSEGCMNIVQENSNMILADNYIESTLFMSFYKYIMGVNSSMLYEAISIRKAVACINFNGCIPHAINKELKKAFTIINEPDDFKIFTNKSRDSSKYAKTFYSEFDPYHFDKIIKSH